MTTDPQPLRIPIGRNVTYAVRGMPEVANQYGPGFLLPTEVSLTYRATEDSQLGRFHAYVKGHWLRDGEQVPSGEKLPGQHYYGDPDGWPDWLAAEARLHDPDAAVPSAPADRAAILREAEAALRAQGKRLAGEFNDSDILHEDGPAAAVATWKHAADLLRRMADAASGPSRVAGEAPQPETQAAPRRGDAFEQWLKAQRDRYDRTDQNEESSEFWHEFDAALDLYRLHADTGTPLGEHVCEGQAVGDCECLEQPAAVSQPGKEA